MGLLGRYTQYVGALSAAHTLLGKLFPGGPFAAQTETGDEKGAQAIVQTAAVAPVDASGVGGLLPSKGVQSGDPGMFPNGVDLTFAGATVFGSNSPPDVSTVKWTNPGDPANPYIPDPTSPGVGNAVQQSNPGISVSDIEAPFVPSTDGSDTSGGFGAFADDTAGSNVANPVTAGPLIGSAGAPGTSQTAGQSGAGVPPYKG